MNFSQIAIGGLFLYCKEPTEVFERLSDGQNPLAMGFAKRISDGKTRPFSKMEKVIPKSQGE